VRRAGTKGTPPDVAYACSHTGIIENRLSMLRGFALVTIRSVMSSVGASGEYCSAPGVDWANSVWAQCLRGREA
jgi:hypothetical protein